MSAAGLLVPVVRRDWWGRLQQGVLVFSDGHVMQQSSRGETTFSRPLSDLVALHWEMGSSSSSSSMSLSVVSSSSSSAVRPSSAIDLPSSALPDYDDDGWLCATCGVSNESSASACELCAAAKPASASSSADNNNNNNNDDVVIPDAAVFLRPEFRLRDGAQADEQQLWIVSSAHAADIEDWLDRHQAPASPSVQLRPRRSLAVDSEHDVFADAQPLPSQPDDVHFDSDETLALSAAVLGDDGDGSDVALPAHVASWVEPRRRAEEPIKGRGLFFSYYQVDSPDFPVIERPCRFIVQTWRHGRCRVVAVNPADARLCLPLAETGAKGARAQFQARRILDWLALAVASDPLLSDPAVDGYRALLGGHVLTVRRSASSEHLAVRGRRRWALFEETVAGDGQPTDPQCELLAGFVASVYGRLPFLRRLDGVGRQLYPKLSEFVYKTNPAALAQFERAVQQCIDNWSRYQLEQPIERKVPREQLRLIESTIKLAPTLRRLLHVFQLSLSSSSSPSSPSSSKSSTVGTERAAIVERLEPLLALIERATAWRDECLAALCSASDLHTGDLIAYPLENDRYYRSCRRGVASRAFFSVWFGAAVGHVALAIRPASNGDGGRPERLLETHMWGQPSRHVVTPFTLGTLGNIFFSPRPETMVADPRHLELIARAFPEEPSAADAIRKVFHLALLEWHEHNEDWLQQSRNDAKYRYIVALVFNTVSVRSATWRDRASFDWGSGKPGNQVACSEFAIRCWLQALDRCGQLLAAAIDRVDPSTHVPLDGSTIFRNDLISGYRRVMRYSPGQLTFRLRRSRFAQELSVPGWHTLFS